MTLMQDSWWLGLVTSDSHADSWWLGLVTSDSHAGFQAVRTSY